MSSRSARDRRDRPTRSGIGGGSLGRDLAGSGLGASHHHRGRGCPRSGCCRVTLVDRDPHRVARGGNGHGVLDQAHGRGAEHHDFLGVRHQDEERCHRLHGPAPRAGDDVLVSGLRDHDLGSCGRVRHRVGHDLGGAAGGAIRDGGRDLHDGGPFLGRRRERDRLPDRALDGGLDRLDRDRHDGHGRHRLHGFGAAPGDHLPVPGRRDERRGRFAAVRRRLGDDPGGEDRRRDRAGTNAGF